MTVAFAWSDLAYIALAIFLLLTGVTLGYAFVRLGAVLRRVSSLIRGAERELIPVISKVGGTLDRVNDQLDKVDVMTDSALDAVTAVDSVLRTASSVVTRPVQKLAGLVTGARHATSTLRAGGGWRSAVRTGQEEALRREQELADELERIE